MQHCIVSVGSRYFKTSSYTEFIEERPFWKLQKDGGFQNFAEESSLGCAATFHTPIYGSMVPIPSRKTEER